VLLGISFYCHSPSWRQFFPLLLSFKYSSPGGLFVAAVYWNVTLTAKCKLFWPPFLDVSGGFVLSTADCPFAREEGTLCEVCTRGLMLARLSFYSTPIQELDMHCLMFGIVKIVPDATSNATLSWASFCSHNVLFALLHRRPFPKNTPKNSTSLLLFCHLRSFFF